MEKTDTNGVTEDLIGGHSIMDHKRVEQITILFLKLRMIGDRNHEQKTVNQSFFYCTNIWHLNIRLLLNKVLLYS
jgi:hypothetical protein